MRKFTGFELDEEDKRLWDLYHNDRADLSGMKSSFHVFAMPRAVHFKGDEAKHVVRRMFAPEKRKEKIGLLIIGEVLPK